MQKNDSRGIQRTLMAIGLWQTVGAFMLSFYLVRAIARGLPYSPFLSLGFGLCAVSVISGVLLMKRKRIGLQICFAIQTLQLFSLAFTKFGFVLILGPQVRISLIENSAVALNAGLFGLYALFVGSNGGLPWGVNLMPLLTLGALYQARRKGGMPSQPELRRVPWTPT